MGAVCNHAIRTFATTKPCLLQNQESTQSTHPELLERIKKFTNKLQKQMAILTKTLLECPYQLQTNAISNRDGLLLLTSPYMLPKHVNFSAATHFLIFFHFKAGFSPWIAVFKGNHLRPGVLYRGEY